MIDDEIFLINDCVIFDSGQSIIYARGGSGPRVELIDHAMACCLHFLLSCSNSAAHEHDLITWAKQKHQLLLTPSSLSQVINGLRNVFAKVAPGYEFIVKAPRGGYRISEHAFWVKIEREFAGENYNLTLNRTDEHENRSALQAVALGIAATCFLVGMFWLPRFFLPAANIDIHSPHFSTEETVNGVHIFYEDASGATASAANNFSQSAVQIAQYFGANENNLNLYWLSVQEKGYGLLCDGEFTSERSRCIGGGN